MDPMGGDGALNHTLFAAFQHPFMRSLLVALAQVGAQVHGQSCVRATRLEQQVQYCC